MIKSPTISGSANTRMLTLALLCAAISACSTPSSRPDGASALRARLSTLQADRQLADRAPLARREAEQAVSAAEQPVSDRAQGEHLVFIADRKISVAEAESRSAYLVEQRAQIAAARTQMQLDARTHEADSANLRAADAQAEASNQQQRARNADTRTAIAQSDASAQRQEADQARLRAADAQAESEGQQIAAARARDQVAAARDDAAAAQGNAEQLQLQLNALNARVTDRGTVVTLGDVLFAFGTADLNAGGHHHLEQLAAFLTRYPDRHAAIEGYTDNIGGDEFNLGLSQRRAQSVKDFLVAQGIRGDRLTATGKGKGSPVGDNGSSTGRQQNRRVEVVIANSVVSSN
jgi:outer membrane protein OmpA-like peptidoglycan-associated protein